jgi:ABC-2 type transport system permease protein
MSRWREFFSNVGAVAYKEATVISHDKAFLSAVLIQPWMMFLVFGVILSNEPKNVHWSVLDQSQSALSRRLVAEIQTSGYFVVPDREASYERARERLRDGSVLAVLVIPPSLARDAERGDPRVQLLLDGSDPLSAARIGGYVSRIAGAVESRIEVASFNPDRAVEKPGPIDVRQRFWFNSNLDDRRFFLAGLAGMLLTNLCLSVSCLALVGERESGTYEQMLALPTRPIEIVLGKLIPYVVICYGLMLFAVIAPGLIFGFWPRGSWLALAVATLPFTFGSLAIGVFVSTIVRTSAQAVFISVFFIMPSFVLSGVMMPYQFMPHGVREVGAVFPLRWYQIALRRVIERGGGLFEIAVPILAMSLIFGVLLAIIRWRMKPRLG